MQDVYLYKTRKSRIILCKDVILYCTRRGIALYFSSQSVGRLLADRAVHEYKFRGVHDIISYYLWATLKTQNRLI